MGKTTGIAYTHHTRGFWSGCSKIGPGCDSCYAEAFNRWTRGKNPKTGEARNWGPGAPRIAHLEGAARDLRKWNRQAAEARERRRVFINTQSDTFDNEVPDTWRDAVWTSIRECKALDFLLVTKRIGNVAKMVPMEWLSNGFPANARLLITVCNQEEAARDVPKLLALPCKNGISYEPALELVEWHLTNGDVGGGIEWIIVGGESAQAGHKARPFDLDWARSTIAQCREARVPVFLKQLGSNPGISVASADLDDVLGLDDDMRGQPETLWCPLNPPLTDRAGADPSEWPTDLRIQEYPR